MAPPKDSVNYMLSSTGYSICTKESQGYTELENCYTRVSVPHDPSTGLAFSRVLLELPYTRSYDPFNDCDTFEAVTEKGDMVTFRITKVMREPVCAVCRTTNLPQEGTYACDNDCGVLFCSEECSKKDDVDGHYCDYEL